MTRVGIAGLWHETNTYSSKPTELADFVALELLKGEDVLEAHQGTGSVLGGMLDVGGFDVARRRRCHSSAPTRFGADRGRPHLSQ
ncbi:MAG: M81 family metallopeptidase [Acidimicrobiia bacterium]